MIPSPQSPISTPPPSASVKDPSPVVGLRRRPSKVIRFGKAALEAAISVAAAGDVNPVEVWIAFDSFINKRNRELRLAGTAPLRVPSLPRFLKLIDDRIGVESIATDGPLKVIEVPKPITTRELARVARAEVMKVHSEKQDIQSVQVSRSVAATSMKKGRR